MDNSVLIVGAGPIGLCLAIALAQRGLDVDVIERQDAAALADPAFDGREVAITRASRHLLETLGVWSGIRTEDTAPLQRARVMDDADRGFEVSGTSFGADHLGTLVANHAIRRAAWEVAHAHPAIRLHTGGAVARAQSDPLGAVAYLEDGRALRASLLVAADSRFSPLRRMQGIATALHDFGKTMILCRARHSRHNDGTAWEWFGRGQTRALLPLEDHLSSLVLTVPSQEVAALLALSPEALAEELAARYEGRLGAVTLASPVKSYPLVASWAHRFVAPRFALAGDAAIGMHPVTAHGFNLGLTGVRHLSDAVTDGLRLYRDPGHAAALRRYQRRLRRDATILFMGTQMVAQLFTDDRAPARVLRRALLTAGRHLPPLTRALGAQVVVGAPGDLPLGARARTFARIVLPPPPRLHAPSSTPPKARRPQ